MQMSSVSIITISQYSRFKCLQNLYELIQLQDYPFILEWIIVEGSKTKESKIENSKQIHEYFPEKNQQNMNQQIIQNINQKIIPTNEPKMIPKNNPNGGLFL